MKDLDKEFAATVLLEAAYTTDAIVCQKYGISLRTLQRYRKALSESEELTQFVATKKAALDELWAEQLPRSLRSTIEFLGEAAIRAKADASSYRNPALIEAVAGAMKLCADVYYTGKVIDARIAANDRATNDVSGSVSTETGSPLTSESVN
jgi:hypothetical protein